MSRNGNGNGNGAARLPLDEPVLRPTFRRERSALKRGVWPVAGVRGAGYVLLRLPLEVRDLFVEWLNSNFPDRTNHVMKLIRDMRGGKDYDSTFGQRMTGAGPYAWMIGRRFENACARLGLNRRKLKLATEHFTPTRKRPQQLSLL